MASLELSRRAALVGLGAIALATTNPLPATGSTGSGQVLLIPYGPLWSDPDFMTIGIGVTGHLLISGGIPNLWLGREFLATAGVEPWRVPGAAAPREVFRAAPSRRGRPLTLVVGDLADRRWLEVARQVMAEARAAGRFVVGANACFDVNRLPFEALVERLGAVCDCFILDPDLPTHVAGDMDMHDQAILVVSSLEAIAAVAAHRSARAIASRMTCRIYRSTTERLDWQVGCSPLPLALRSTSMPPTLLSWHLPHFLSPRLARAFRNARRALWPRPADLMADACCDEAYTSGRRINMIASWLTPLACLPSPIESSTAAQSA